MRIPFDPSQRLIVISARIDGPTGHVYVRLALDTGASLTMVRTATLVSIGYGPTASPRQIRMTTGSGIETVPPMKIRVWVGDLPVAPTFSFVVVR